ncbi:MAG: hypothetical protein JXA33_14625, partial [Anaerolineae bacterium]|nr:hypothetical protein [Anaerolineae bacterium]
KMTIEEVYKYLRLMKGRYERADRKTKGELLNEMEQVTGRQRKSLIRLLRGNLHRQPRQRERGRTYKADVDDALRVIWEKATTISVRNDYSPIWYHWRNNWPSTGKYTWDPHLCNSVLSKTNTLAHSCH